MHRRLPLSVDEIRRDLSRFNFFERYVHGKREGDVYVASHARRFLETLNQLPELPEHPRVLELGGVPYSMTILMEKHLGARVTPLSFYEVEVPQGRHVLESPDGTERYEFPYISVNVERERYPLSDASFDLVLCCEILEHLLINPSHMFFEAHRVLVPGGFILVSTPNVIRAANLRALQERRNINDAYHGNGIYGRHNREFAPDEVPLLLEACGYTVVRNTTVDVYDSTPPGAEEGREDTIFTLARTSGPRRIATPSQFYVLMDEYLNVIHDGITMGVDDVGHLGRGWHDLEDESGRGFRWMGGRAVLHLRLQGAHHVRLHGQVHHPDVASNPVEISLCIADEVVATRHIADHRWQDIEFALPRSLSGSVEMQIAVDRTWTPSGGDERELGLRIHRCWGA